MALSIMRMMTVIIVMSIAFAGFATILNEYGQPSTTIAAGIYTPNSICLGGCYSNTSRNASATFYNSSLNPLKTTASKSFNLSNNLTSSSQAVGFSFAFIINNLGNIVTSTAQAPRVLTTMLSAMLGNMNILVGGSQSLTAMIIGGIVSLISLYITLIFISSWLKFPLV